MKTLPLFVMALSSCVLVAAEDPLPAFSEKKLELPSLSLRPDAPKDLFSIESPDALGFRGTKPIVVPDSKFVITPRDDVDYKMIIKKPDPTIDYKMIVIGAEPQAEKK